MSRVPILAATQQVRIRGLYNKYNNLHAEMGKKVLVGLSQKMKVIDNFEWCLGRLLRKKAQ